MYGKELHERCPHTANLQKGPRCSLSDACWSVSLLAKRNDAMQESWLGSP